MAFCPFSLKCGEAFHAIPDTHTQPLSTYLPFLHTYLPSLASSNYHQLSLYTVFILLLRTLRREVQDTNKLEGARIHSVPYCAVSPTQETSPLTSSMFHKPTPIHSDLVQAFLSVPAAEACNSHSIILLITASYRPPAESIL